MSKKSLYITLGVLAVVVLYIGSVYNGLLTQKETLDNTWAQVETQYQRRFDLIPNLQATVQGAADFEQSTFTAVTQARSQWQSAGTQTEKIQAINTFDSALSRLLVTVEAYPQLQATQAFQDFMVQLEGTENRIAVARKDYNDQVQTYNIYVRRFPRSMFANMFGYDVATYFRSSADAAEAPTVEF